ncbi:MAG: phosphate ABC transporter permease PtsA, partial [Betaproteobacteria bacterium]|nr:phosphate ABC transporter permease PtsA [Betaproteobacteria bacterium]
MNQSPNIHSEAASKAARFARRKQFNRLAIALSMAAMLFGMFWLAWILWETVYLGISSLSVTMLTENTPPAGDPIGAGGLANAMMGSFLMVALATFVGTPIGILTGIYLAEYDAQGKLAATVRFINDILLSAPSIIIGLFVYAVI